jgi:hypothetical protein
MLQHIITLIAAGMGLLAAILSFLNRRAIKEVHVSLNSRLSELLEQTRKGARAEGVKEGEANRK